MHKLRSFAVVGILFCGLLSLTGCDRSDNIVAYTVPSHRSLQTPEFQAEYDRKHPAPNRMLAVAIPQPDFQWFFKLEGEPDVVQGREEDVRSFLKTIHFTSPEEIDWQLPDGWQKRPGSQLRYATIMLNGAVPLEMSVTRLPTQPDKTPLEQVVLNINRWRGQLSLPSIDEEDLPNQSEKLELNGCVGYWINIVGRPKPRPAAMTPPPRQAQPAENKPANTGGPAYELPEGWTVGRPNSMAVVSLQAIDGDSKLTITVTSAGGNRLDNVNRWRNQLQLKPIEEAELTSSAIRIAIGPLVGELFEMSNDEKSIFGAIVTAQNQSWFVKMMGDKGLAERERSHFEAFLKSLRWN